MNQPIPFSQAALQLDPRDPLAIAKQEVHQGALIRADIPALPFQSLEMRQTIPAGHKFALQNIATGEEIRRYGCRIGQAVQDILPGEWIHTHNLSVGDMAREFRIGIANPVAPANRNVGAQFMGFRRADGKVGTRNVIAVISTVSCAAQTARAIAQAFTGEVLTDFPNVDGVVAVAHSLGCGAPIGGTAFQYLQRALLNLTRHPNVGGVVFVSLGCENNQMADLLPTSLDASSEPGSCLIGSYLTIQQEGGIDKTVAAGIAAVKSLLPRVNTVTRSPAPLSSLTVALQCGGSDSWSGVTANPLVGLVSDHLVQAGGTVVLAETPEIYGAEQLLLSRVRSAAVGEKLIARLRWWQAQAELLGFSLDNNPSPGNKAGGLTTIFEKSLGAVSKGGSSPLMEVLEYAEWVNASGLVFMDTPGYDPVSVTGQVAGGCNLTLFTTGRGSVFGGILSPCIKIASNSAMYQRIESDMDVNAGALLDQHRPLDSMAGDLLAHIVQVASGARTKSERTPFREAEFVPWHVGGML